MKKALIVSTVSRQFYLFEQVNIAVLRRLGYEVHGAANFQDRNERLNEVSIIEHQVDFVRSPFSISNIKAYRQLKKLINDQQFDIIHAHSPVGGVIARLAAPKNVKKIYTAHGFHFFKGAPIMNWLLFYPIEKWLSKLTDVLITINQEDYSLAKSRFHMKELYQVEGVGVDYKKFQPVSEVEKQAKKEQLGFANYDQIMIYVGELSHRKNQQLLIKAMAEIHKSFPKAVLLLVGSGKLKKDYKELITRLGLGDCVKLLGFRNDIANLMQISDIAVSSSRQEGLPVNLMEALGTGLPLVVSNCRGNRDLIKNDYNGYLIPEENVELWISHLKNLLDNNDRQDQFGQHSLSLSNRYSRENIEEVMYQIYGNFEYKEVMNSAN